ncbi:metallophosphoesterase [Wenjunlia tyrosinilytica]|uniref:metallophosphoesterase n=1 Tax=Wenjunlia tyrosinilytica TaxID=1544741 RepID=UPI003570DC42
MPLAAERFLAWPGYLWLAMILYLTLPLLVGEAARPLLLRALRHRATRERGAGTAQDGRPRLCAAEAAHHRDTEAPGDGLEGAAVADAASAAEAARARGGQVGAATGQGRRPGARAAQAAGRGSAEALGGDPATQDRSAAPAAGARAAEPAHHRGPEAVPGGPAVADAFAARPSTSPAGSAGEASRRLFVSRGVAIAAGVVATGTVGYGMRTALGPPRVKRVTVPLAKLGPQGHGFRIAVVSDIHLGPILGRAHTQRIVDTVNRTRPDLVAVVGDLVDGSVHDLGRAAEPLARLRSRHGSFFVTGNHEYFSGAAEWVDHVRSLGVHPLENARVEVPGFDLAGVNDLGGESEGQGPDFGKALGDRDPARACVLLAHQPVQIHEAVRHHVDLQLSGHTHGGQMWPGDLIAALPNPTVAGLERYGDTQLYVTRGAGFWGPPVRVAAPPDITVVELASPRA